ncbi:hypothetical protein QBC34DRAFT_143908 [Podospora aff. communis PSN243]|uniref:LYR motif-containing protein Cup1-like N-terminal domain-containing protein n=1 Tax=Podospora aff. communis PSN243 TaxID=3040156 RepID=A0AAV9GG82_9PEZI|nr:hypothetical protein QBC34DRAFT_143908 [Podospora aff. communis PSN243]
MSRPLRIPRPETPLHLYRHLLRESSYLPPFVRTVIDSRIKERFRRHQNNEWEKPIKTAMRRGNHELRALRAAVAGDLPRMQKVLFLAFGRTGWRRRELMDILAKREETPDDHPNALEEPPRLEKRAKDDPAALDREEDWLDHWDLPKIMAFARSQTRDCEQNNKPGRPLQGKQLDFEQEIPKIDIWGRPLARKLKRGKIRRGWKLIAEKILPPLPAREWDMLRDLVSGKGIDPKWAFSHRRALAQSPTGTEQDPHPWKWEAYATRAVSIVDYQINRKNKLLSGAQGDGTPWGDPEPINVHKWTPQLWRRLLSQVFKLTAKMQRIPGGNGWDIVWGSGSFKPPAADAGAMEFLEGYARPVVPEYKPNPERRARRAARKAEKAAASAQGQARP